MKKIMKSTSYFAMSLFVLANNPIFAMDSNTINVPEKSKILWKQEVSEIRGKLEAVKNRGVEPYTSIATEALKQIGSNLPQARAALAYYNAHVMAAEMAKGHVSSSAAPHLPPHAMENLMHAVKSHAADCTKRLAELQSSVSSLGEGGSSADGALVAELRAEIIRLGGSSREVEAVVLPALDSPFIYVSAVAHAANPQEAEAENLKQNIIRLLDEITLKINNDSIKLSIPRFKNKWALVLSEFKDILDVDVKNIDWNDFSNTSIQIKEQDPFKFFRSKIPDGTREFEDLKRHIDELTNLRSSLQKSQQGEEYGEKQRQLAEEDSRTGHLDAILVHFLTDVRADLARLMSNPVLASDAMLKSKLKEISDKIDARKMTDLIKFFDTVDKRTGMKIQDFMRQAMIRHGLMANPDWNNFERMFSAYKAALSAMGNNQKILVLLHLMRHGKKDYQETLAKIQTAAHGDASLHRDAGFALSIPDVFTLTGEPRKRFMEALGTLKTTYDGRAATPVGKLVMDLYYSYYEVFDAATKLYFDENPPLHRSSASAPAPVSSHPGSSSSSPPPPPPP